MDLDANLAITSSERTAAKVSSSAEDGMDNFLLRRPPRSCSRNPLPSASRQPLTFAPPSRSHSPPGRWPVKSVKFLLALLKNAEANAEAKGLATEELVIRNIVIQQAPKTRRRTFRAHGRINPYEGHPIHAEILLSEPAAQVPKASTDVSVRLNKRQLAQKRVAAARAIKA